MKVILFSGKAQSGKDTSANILKIMMKSKGRKVLILHYGDLLKYICKSYFDWNGEKDEYGRSLLQHVGTEIVRAKDENFWVDFIVRLLKVIGDQWDYILIPDTRFPNEIEVLKNEFDLLHVRVEREGFENGLTESQKNHKSEISLDSVNPDFIIDNSSDVSHLVDEVYSLFTSNSFLQLDTFHHNVMINNVVS